MRNETNTLDTSPFTNQFSVGNRIEFGRIENRNGWFVSIYQQRDQTQAFLPRQPISSSTIRRSGPHGEKLLQGNVNNDAHDLASVFPAGIQEPCPPYFNNVLVENAIDTWGVEANYLHRFLTGHNGGTFEMFLGARYFEFNDNFNVHTAVAPTP